MTLSSISKKSILSAAIGTALEWYDFSIFIYVTPFISVLFFPEANHLVAIMSTFGIFAAGCFMRPLGGIFFGNLGDKIGRKKVLILAVVLMSIPMLVMVFLPTYKTLGIGAVVLLILCRLVQGFSVGGEYSGVLVLLLEQADDSNRGFITSFGTFVSGLGILLSSLVVTILTLLLSHKQMLSWGWRIPFVVGVILAIYTLVMQASMKESPHFEKLKESGHLSKHPAYEAITKFPKRILIAIGITGFAGMSYYVVAAFIPTYLENILNIKSSTVMIVSTLSVAIYAFSAPFWGKLSDRIGRKKQLIFSASTLVVIGYPCFFLLSISQGNFWVIFISEAALMLFVTAFMAAFVSAINELFPTKERFSGAAIGYNVGNALFASTAPIICTLLIQVTHGNAIAPVLYLITGGILAILIVLCMKETANRPLEEY